ncbi:MAG: hypothetical protein ACJA13_000936 [Paraglaciecola sp.]|jgi:hypothetical protein
MSSYTKNIRPHVKVELDLSIKCLLERDPATAFEHLENAHILGQESTFLHVLAHIHMARWAIHQRDAKEFLGQVFRIIGAATKTVIRLVPTGNSGGSNISPFRPLPLSAKHERLISRAKAKV